MSSILKMMYSFEVTLRLNKVLPPPRNIKFIWSCEKLLAMMYLLRPSMAIRNAESVSRVTLYPISNDFSLIS